MFGLKEKLLHGRLVGRWLTIVAGNAVCRGQWLTTVFSFSWRTCLSGEALGAHFFGKQESSANSGHTLTVQLMCDFRVVSYSVCSAVC